MKIHDPSFHKPRHSAAEIERAVSDYARGDGTQRAIALRYGVSTSTIRNWLRRTRPDAAPAAPAFVELVPSASACPIPYRIELSNGRSLVLPPDWESARVRELIQLLSRL